MIIGLFWICFWYEEESNFSPLHVDIQLYQHHLLERLYIPCWVSWPVFVKLIVRSCMGLFLYLCHVWSVKCLFCSLLSASVLTEIALSTGAPLPRNPTPRVFADRLGFGILLQCVANLFTVLSLRFLLALSLKISWRWKLGVFSRPALGVHSGCLNGGFSMYLFSSLSPQAFSISFMYFKPSLVSGGSACVFFPFIVFEEFPL